MSSELRIRPWVPCADASSWGVRRGSYPELCDGIVSENAVMFKVTVSFEDSSVKDSKGNEVKIVNGMTSTVWTVYEKSTYLKYFLDKLGIKT